MLTQAVGLCNELYYNYRELQMINIQGKEMAKRIRRAIFDYRRNEALAKDGILNKKYSTWLYNRQLNSGVHH